MELTNEEVRLVLNIVILAMIDMKERGENLNNDLLVKLEGILNKLEDYRIKTGMKL